MSSLRRSGPPAPRYLPRALKEAARAGNGHGLVHDPFAEAEVLVDPLVGLFVLARDFFRLEGQAGRSLHACKKCRDEDSVKGIVRQSSDNHVFGRCEEYGVAGRDFDRFVEL